MTKRSLLIGAWCLSLLLCLWLFLPAPAQAQLANALTRAALQASNFVLTGSWDLSSAAHMKLRRASSAPVGNTVGDFYFNTVSNNWWYTAANGTWTTVAAGNMANPYTPNQQFSGIVDFTGTVSLPRQQTIEVCKAGCPYSNVDAAIAAITDSAANKRYRILIHPGFYSNVTIQPPSYTTFQGFGQNATRLESTISITAGVTEVAIDNLTVSLVKAEAGIPGSRTTLYISNTTLGIQDGVDGVGKNNHSLWALTDLQDIYSWNNTFLCSGSCDVVEIGRGSRFYDTGSIYLPTDDAGAAGATIHVWHQVIGESNGEWYIQNAKVIASFVGDAGEFVGMRFNPFSGTTNGANRFFLNNSLIDVTYTSATNASQMTCFVLENCPTNALASVINLDGTICRLTAGSTRTLTGLKVVSDADHAQFKIQWNGGRIDLSGSGSKFDIDTAENNASFSINIANVVHSGVYNGAGTSKIFVDDLRQGKFTTSLVTPAGALTCGAGTAGKVAVHTTPFQYCDNAGTPALQYAAYGSSTGVATSATALAANGANCSGNNFALGVDASGVGECAQPAFSNLSGTATDGQLPVTLANHTLTAPLITLADLVVGTCTAGQLGVDNGGATKEWCVCGTTNTWGCWKLSDGTFNANGPAD